MIYHGVRQTASGCVYRIGLALFCPASDGIGESRRLSYTYIWAYETEDCPMPKERRSFSGAEKMAILREHLIERGPISEVCDKHGLQPTVFYGWQKKLFEEGAAVFEQSRAKTPRQEAVEQRRIAFLEAKLRNKDEVMAERLGEHVALKKSLGEF